MPKSKPKQKYISIEEYSKKMDKIIEKYKNSNVGECLIALLEEASKYKFTKRKDKNNEAKCF